MTGRADEGRHQPGPGAGRGWEESYYFDFIASGPGADAGPVAGFVRLGLRPAEGRCWYWAALVGAPAPGPALVLVRDQEVDLPRGRALEVRASGLWADLTCETPLDHWTIGLEAFGVSLEHPADAFRGELGERWSLGFDLEWECTGPPVPVGLGGAEGYQQPCTVHGEILEGSRSIDLDGRGWRSHAWGERGWWSAGSSWVGCHLDDGTPLASGATAGAQQGLPADGLVRRATFDAGGVRLEVTPVRHAPVAVEGDGVTSRLDRALCRVVADDGRAGAGWAEWLSP